MDKIYTKYDLHTIGYYFLVLFTGIMMCVGWFNNFMTKF